MGHARPDREAIIGLTLAYCSALDTGAYEQLRGVFTPDATAGLGGSGQVGVDQIIERVSSALGGFDRCEHRLTDHWVEVAGDTATARCSVRALHMRPSGETPPVYIVGGIYEDRLVRTDAGWRISHRELIVESRDG
jgi:hypothetical protein